MNDQISTENSEIVSVEEIMEAIRQKISANKERIEVSDQQVERGNLPAQYYEEVEEARVAFDRIQPQPQVIPTTNPILGRLLYPLRYKLHELVLFYVNQLAANQIRVNAHMLRALEILGEEVEKSRPDER